MRRRLPFLAALYLLATAGFCAEPVAREAVVQSLLDRSRLLDDVHFRVVRSVYEGFVRATLRPQAGIPAPVPLIAAEGVYALAVPATRQPVLSATLRYRVFEPERCVGTPVLSTALAWENVRLDGQPADLPAEKGWLRLPALAAGPHEITATSTLREAPPSGAGLDLAIARTVRSVVAFDSPDTWELAVSGGHQHLVGAAPAGTHGQVAVTPRRRLSLRYHPPRPVTERPPRFAVRGDVAWNLDAAIQQVAARLDVAIIGGRAERVELTLPATTDRVEVSGPDVRETQLAPGRATVFLRGRIAERTRLRVSFEMPHGTGARRLPAPAVRDGHWAGGTLVVTNTAGGSEVLPGSTVGLRRMALADVPASARGILAGPPTLAFEVTSRSWSAEVELLNLAEFALRESIADLAHYQVGFRPDGTLLCKASYEIRNRTRQFLQLVLPEGAVVLESLVNDKPVPLTAKAGGAWLLPLVRSTASVKGLVTFPVEIVFLCRTAPLVRRGQTGLALPRIDVPIAYAWCEAYVPEGMEVPEWGGPLRAVERYSNETATATMSYGLGMAAEGYRPATRPAPETPEGEPKPAEKPRRDWGVVRWFRERPFSIVVGGMAADAPAAAAPPPVQPAVPQTWEDTGGGTVQLGRNYYRAGKSFYDKQDYANAAESLEKVLKFNPKSPEAFNAAKLLANIRTVVKNQEGGQAGAQSGAAKAARIQVTHEVQTRLAKLERRQEKLLERGLYAAAEGRKDEASKTLEAARSLGEQLIAQGANKAEQLARLRKAQVTLGDLRKDRLADAKERFKKVRELEGKGDYELAYKTAQKLQTGGLISSGKLGGWVASLAAKAAREKAEKQERSALVKRLDSLNRKVAEQHRRLSRAGDKAAIAHRPRPTRGEVARQSVEKLHKEIDKLEKLADAQRDVLDKGTGRKRRLPGEARPTPGKARDQAKTRFGTVRAYDISDLTLDYGEIAEGQKRLAREKAQPTPLRRSGEELDGAILGGEDSGRTKLKPEELLGLVRRTVAPHGWDESGRRAQASVSFEDGQIVVRGSQKGQKAVSDVLNELRRARGPQVERGGLLARQEGTGVLHEDRFDGDRPTGEAIDRNGRFQSFVARNYKWALAGDEPDREDSRPRRPDGPVPVLDDLSTKLGTNLGQKVQFNSINLNVGAAAAQQLGATFVTGNNNLRYGLVDEGQLRTLLQAGAARGKRGTQVASNASLQEAIVGTNALLANGMIANPRFAGDVANTLEVNGNLIDLTHEKYIVIDNGGFLTAVQANPMQHWTEARNPFPFVAAAPDIQVPRVGRLVKFEKALVEPTDDLTLRGAYTWKGVQR